MLIRLRHASARRLPRPLDRLPALTKAGTFVYAHTRRDARNAATGAKPRGKGQRTLTSIQGARDAGILEINTPLARKLDQGELWNPRGSGAALQSTDIRRVNIVNEELCNDIIKTIGPSLERHRGCDIIDLNPGAGLWSRTLHDAIQPRQHLMLDAAADMYGPLLKETMGDRKNYEIIQKNGFNWAELKEVLTSRIDPHHPPLERHQPGPDGLREVPSPERNDMLLVTANVSNFPKRVIYSFDSLSTMLIYQLLSSIRSSALFQRYGCVRMLIWANDENKRAIVPRSMLQRRRPGFEAELSCDWLHEVVGHDYMDPHLERFVLRDDWLNIESAAGTLQRMESAGIPVIKGRETRALSTILANEALRGGVGSLAGHLPPNIPRPFKAELAELESGDHEEDQERLKKLQRRQKYDDTDSQLYLELLQKIEAAHNLASNQPLSPEKQAELHAIDAELAQRVDSFKKNHRSELGVLRDSYHLFRHTKPEPALHWDRRAYEPLAVKPAEDFYPNVPMCLLDIQPKPMNPLFRQCGPGTSRSGDISDLLLRMAFAHLNHPIQTRGMDNFWPGFGSMVDVDDPEAGEKYCASLRDPNRGGSPLTGSAELTMRAMNEVQWADLVKAWMNWPFRPPYESMIGRLTLDSGEDEGAKGKGI